MELIIQKAVELGACEIIPVATRRSVVKLDKKKEENKVRRWSHCGKRSQAVRPDADSRGEGCDDACGGLFLFRKV